MKRIISFMTMIFLLSCGKSGVHFQESFQNTLARAKETGKSILINFYSPT